MVTWPEGASATTPELQSNKSGGEKGGRAYYPSIEAKGESNVRSGGGRDVQHQRGGLVWCVNGEKALGNERGGRESFAAKKQFQGKAEQEDFASSKGTGRGKGSPCLFFKT